VVIFGEAVVVAPIVTATLNATHDHYPVFFCA
jgi:hypothetical protein